MEEDTAPDISRPATLMIAGNEDDGGRAAEATAAGEPRRNDVHDPNTGVDAIMNTVPLARRSNRRRSGGRAVNTYMISFAASKSRPYIGQRILVKYEIDKHRAEGVVKYVGPVHVVGRGIMVGVTMDSPVQQHRRVEGEALGGFTYFKSPPGTGVFVSLDMAYPGPAASRTRRHQIASSTISDVTHLLPNSAHVQSAFLRDDFLDWRRNIFHRNADEGDSAEGGVEADDVNDDDMDDNDHNHLSNEDASADGTSWDQNIMRRLYSNFQPPHDAASPSDQVRNPKVLIPTLSHATFMEQFKLFLEKVFQFLNFQLKRCRLLKRYERTSSLSTSARSLGASDPAIVGFGVGCVLDVIQLRELPHSRLDIYEIGAVWTLCRGFMERLEGAFNLHSQVDAVADLRTTLLFHASTVVERTCSEVQKDVNEAKVFLLDVGEPFMPFKTVDSTPSNNAVDNNIDNLGTNQVSSTCFPRTLVAAGSKLRLYLPDRGSAPILDSILSTLDGLFDLWDSMEPMKMKIAVKLISLIRALQAHRPAKPAMSLSRRSLKESLFVYWYCVVVVYKPMKQLQECIQNGFTTERDELLRDTDALSTACESDIANALSEIIEFAKVFTETVLATRHLRLFPEATAGNMKSDFEACMDRVSSLFVFLHHDLGDTILHPNHKDIIFHRLFRFVDEEMSAALIRDEETAGTTGPGSWQGQPGSRVVHLMKMTQQFADSVNVLTVSFRFDFAFINMIRNKHETGTPFSEQQVLERLVNLRLDDRRRTAACSYMDMLQESSPFSLPFSPTADGRGGVTSRFPIHLDDFLELKRKSKEPDRTPNEQVDSSEEDDSRFESDSASSYTYNDEEVEDEDDAASASSVQDNGSIVLVNREITTVAMLEVQDDGDMSFDDSLDYDEYKK